MSAETDSYHHPELKARLLETARLELAQMGVRNFSLRAVAGRAGVSRTAPYRHFEGRDGLLGALTAQGFLELTAALREADAGCPGSSLDKLLAQGSAYLDFGRRRPELLELIFSNQGILAVMKDASIGRSPPSADYDAFGVLEARVAACQAEGILSLGLPPYMVATLVWSTVHGLSTLEREGVLGHMAVERGLAPEAAANTILGALRGLYLGPDLNS
ncbi:MAG TPA: TetR/AcrR family transcriptional regulator [bacterium]|nr:TetR/AcrR family transcriptional regulator [bacterium]